jgi:hypothetical protein
MNPNVSFKKVFLQLMDKPLRSLDKKGLDDHSFIRRVVRIYKLC